MTVYNAVFKRVEKKYRLRDAQRRAVEAAAESGAMAMDAYGRCRITSLYLDTPERAMIARSVEKPLYKEKLRLRVYGDAAGAALMAAFGGDAVGRERGGLPLSDEAVRVRAAVGAKAAAAVVRTEVDGADARNGSNDSVFCAAGTASAIGTADGSDIAVFFGIKKKFKGIVYKRRLALSLPAAVAFASGLPYELACTRWPLADEAQARVALAPVTRQIARELTAAMDRWTPLVPSMGIACDRVAWGYESSALPAREEGAPFDPELRITFDDRLQYFDCLAATPCWRPLIDSGETIMEIKSAGPYPFWLVQALSASAIYPTSFTKYGSAYRMVAVHKIGANLAKNLRSASGSSDFDSNKYRNSIYNDEMDCVL